MIDAMYMAAARDCRDFVAVNVCRLVLLASAFTIIVTGCARPAGVIFPPDDRAPVWPPPPDPPRIRWLGQLATDADLKPARSGWQAFADAIAGPALINSVSTPAGIAVMRGERVFVTDPTLRCVHVFDLSARTYGAILDADGAPLAVPADAAVDGSHLFVSDSARRAVFEFDAGGRFVRAIGRDVLQRPIGVATASIEPQGGTRLYVVDAVLHACVVFDANGGELLRFGRRGAGPGEFNVPTDVAVHPVVGVVVADTLNFRVQRFTPDGEFIAAFGARGDGAGDFAMPKGIAVDDTGRIYVADAQFENIQVFTSDGRLLLAIGSEGRGPGEFWLPNQLAIDHNQRLWAADAYNRRVQVFQILPEPSKPIEAASVLRR